MTQIGIFTRTPDGYHGRVRTLTLDVELTLVPAEPTEADNAPDWRVRLGDNDGPEVGAAWKKVGERAGDYLSVQLDDPLFARPIRARLFKSPDETDVHRLVWSRPDKRDAKG